MNKKISVSIIWAILAAALYAISSPVSKILLLRAAPMMMAAFLYLGAGIGMFLLGIIRKNLGKGISEHHLTRKDLPFTVGMIVLDIAAPILLMVGLNKTTAANASLLNNFEIVATSVIALLVFREAIKKRLWLAIGLITLSSLILSFEDVSSLHFSFGSLLVLLACVCWGFENNCTRMMSNSDPLEIVVIKGIGSGLGSLLIACAAGEPFPTLRYVPLILLLGFVSYGLSIFFYVYAQRNLGAAKTSAYYAVAPFIGVALSWGIFRETPSFSFLAALAIMIIGVYFTTTDAKGSCLQR
ncbi:DMT family transporter [Diplocloster modestus]|uniref:DMT family transporter n=1 Tax=Diplocloster modestus TaxID=2850322 RepID=A0ABS6KD59_9FIRM|nr:DMT family transporter [Diplocloster modestus]MBU9728441.1 DMT family transporter [Diplocloster modestus]